MNIFSRITGIFPFSVGEIMIILGIFLLLTALIFLILLPFLKKRLKKVDNIPVLLPERLSITALPLRRLFE